MINNTKSYICYLTLKCAAILQLSTFCIRCLFIVNLICTIFNYILVYCLYIIYTCSNSTVYCVSTREPPMTGNMFVCLWPINLILILIHIQLTAAVVRLDRKQSPMSPITASKVNICVR